MTVSHNTQLYQERLQRIEDAVALRESDRVPFVYSTNFWSAKYAGITFEQAMYDIDRYFDAHRQVIELLQPDAYSAVLFPFGVAVEGVDFKPMRWPGHGADPNATFQYLDQEFMTADEYDDYIFDPTGFYLHKYLPRIAGRFKMLEHFPDFPAAMEWEVVGAVSGFAHPELQTGLQHLFKVGEQTAACYRKLGAFVQAMNQAGYPLLTGAFCKAPYDHFIDTLRGSKGGILDMYQRKDKLLAAMAKARVLLLRNVKPATERSGCRYVFLPLHWGLDGFMSPDQFRTFYWPELKNIIMSLIEMDLVPVVFWEGNCTSRLETIADIPRGKVIYRFEATDMFRAKEVLGNIVCLRGNVPASILNTGTADDVDAYCRKLIQTVGKGGGLILDGAAGIPDEAKVENVIAMAESVRKYAS
ncbi:MAG: Uroporphyrinogen deCOase protein [Gammaproteobacteria bacterium]|nr:Uroporphyrinogen deCOase protein [Gammaproteobacteria bacterium]